MSDVCQARRCGAWVANCRSDLVGLQVDRPPFFICNWADGCPKAEEPSPSRFAVNHVSGLICKACPQYTQKVSPDRVAQGASLVFSASIVQSGFGRLCFDPFENLTLRL